jgi:hypothetical protein
MNRTSPLWAITCYFNPVGFRTRLANYKAFRRSLEVPLLTVEWSTDGRFELSESDADVLVQTQSSDLMWQKERLLNLGLRALPASVEFVAWLDCDVVFQVAGWWNEAQRELESSSLVQLFSQCIFLGPNAKVEQQAKTVGVDVAESIVHLSQQPGADSILHDQLWGAAEGRGPIARRRRLSGLAWAGRRQLLERHGFYDACILGAGDRAFACAAFGQQRRAQQAWLRNSQQRKHYLEWADPFAADVGGRIGMIKGDLLHLWHGRIENRQYRVRHDAAERYCFDPLTDISIDPISGTWRWTGANVGLRRSLQQFFRNRREDEVDRGAADSDSGHLEQVL